MISSDGLKGVEKTIVGAIVWAEMAAYADECRRQMPKGPTGRKTARVIALKRVVAEAQRQLQAAETATYADYDDA